jgi:hypothetical protein
LVVLDANGGRHLVPFSPAWTAEIPRQALNYGQIMVMVMVRLVAARAWRSRASSR